MLYHVIHIHWQQNDDRDRNCRTTASSCLIRHDNEYLVWMTDVCIYYFGRPLYLTRTRNYLFKNVWPTSTVKSSFLCAMHPMCVSRSAASILFKSVREQKCTHTQYIIAPAEINATMLRTNGMHSECYKYGGINNIVIYSYRGCVFFLCISHSWRPKRKAGELTHVLIGSNWVYY